MNRSRLTTIAAAAALTLAAAPAAHATAPENDHFSAATALSGVSQPAAAPYSLTSATKQPYEAVAGAGHTVWFKWKPASSGATFADVCGAPTNHTVRVRKMKAGEPIYVYNLEGARVGAAEDADLPADSFCRFRWRAVKDTTYYIQIDSVGADTSSHELIVDQDTAAPAQPTVDGSTWPGITGPSHLAKFTGGAGVSYVCALDSYEFHHCGNPHQLVGMTDGFHTFSVRTMDAHGNLSPIVSRYWKVETPKPAPVQPTGGEQPATADPSSTDLPVQGSGEPAGATTGVATAVSPAPPVAGACRITLTAPKKIRRAKLRAKGIRVKLAATGEACSPDVFLKQGRRTLAKRSLKLGRLTLRGRKAARGKVTVVAGSTKLTVKVV